MATTNCPNCSTPDLEVTNGGTIDCPNCGIIQVGEPKVCPVCSHENIYNTEICVVCGEPLTIVSQIIVMHSGSRQPFRLKQVRSQASALKEREEFASQHRMKTLQEIDRRREQNLAEAQETQKAHQRRVSTIMLIIAGLFIISIALFAAIFLLR